MPPEAPPGAPSGAPPPPVSAPRSSTGPATASSPDAPPPTLLASLAAFARELPGLLSDRVELLTLELERAGRALAEMVLLLLAAAVLAVTAWLVLWAGIAALLLAFGLPLAAALLLVLLVNVLAAMLAVSRAKRLLPRIGLPATRRHLVPSPSPEPSEPAQAAAVAPGGPAAAALSPR